MRTPQIFGWARPAGYEPADQSHGIVAIDASLVTACSGRWAQSETHDFVWGVDVELDTAGKKLNKCPACVDAAGLSRTRDAFADFVHVATAEQFFDALGKESK